MQPGLDGPDRDAERHGDVAQRHPEVVVQDDDRPAVVVETPQDLVDQLPIGVGGRAVRDRGDR